MEMGKPETIDGRTILFEPAVDGKCNRCGKQGIGIAISVTHADKVTFRDYNKHICYPCIKSASHYLFNGPMYLHRAISNLDLEQARRLQQQLDFTIVDLRLRKEQDDAKK